MKVLQNKECPRGPTGMVWDYSLPDAKEESEGKAHKLWVVTRRVTLQGENQPLGKKIGWP